jgi:hypothetical protein
MIRCHRKQLEDRCKQRGYALANVMPCVIEQDGDRWLIDTEHPAYPRKREEWRPIPIGDLIERGLTAIGITKERVEALTRTEGKPGGCGCAGRQKWLNEVGNKVQIDARNALIAAKRFYVGE